MAYQCDLDEERGRGLTAWARQHPVQQFVIGSLNSQREPAASPAPVISLEEGRARRRRNEDDTNGE